jgi:hypothetical protein
LDYFTQRLRELELNNESLTDQVASLTKQLEDVEIRDAADDHPTDGRRGQSTRNRRSVPANAFEKSIARAGQRFLLMQRLFIPGIAPMKASEAEAENLKEAAQAFREEYINSLPEDARAIYDEDRVIDFVSSSSVYFPATF